MGSARSASTFTPCASRRVSSGAKQHRHATLYISTSSRITLNAPEPTSGAQQPPAFAEPWQAQAFALAVRLSEAGHFTWSERSAALGAELRAAAERGEPDDGSRYYEHWLSALERLVTSKGLADAQTLAARKNEWQHAYRN